MTRFHATKNGNVPFTAEEETARDAEEKEWTDGKPIRDAMRKIERLESTVTPRRLRDALASDEGKKWVDDVEKLIAVERGKL